MCIQSQNTWNYIFWLSSTFENIFEIKWELLKKQKQCPITFFAKANYVGFWFWEWIALFEKSNNKLQKKPHF